eukprot:1157298-Pelagomonas_calceolata.AAC.12
MSTHPLQTNIGTAEKHCIPTPFEVWLPSEAGGTSRMPSVMEGPCSGWSVYPSTDLSSVHSVLLRAATSVCTEVRLASVQARQDMLSTYKATVGNRQCLESGLSQGPSKREKASAGCTSTVQSTGDWAEGKALREKCQRRKESTAHNVSTAQGREERAVGKVLRENRHTKKRRHCACCEDSTKQEGLG